MNTWRNPAEVPGPIKMSKPKANTGDPRSPTVQELEQKLKDLRRVDDNKK
jgi:hypothetical protein